MAESTQTVASPAFLLLLDEHSDVPPQDGSPRGEFHVEEEQDGSRWRAAQQAEIRAAGQHEKPVQASTRAEAAQAWIHVALILAELLSVSAPEPEALDGAQVWTSPSAARGETLSSGAPKVDLHGVRLLVSPLDQPTAARCVVLVRTVQESLATRYAELLSPQASIPGGASALSWFPAHSSLAQAESRTVLVRCVVLRFQGVLPL